ncbi:MAG TPA: hypothetical protein VFZ21_21130 [Gemmatimonadaceae bacterium]|nr:hypothetical protein [Gemmatimonadaceae bacterium]
MTDAPDWDCAARRGLECRTVAGVTSWLLDDVVVVETAGLWQSPLARRPGGPWQRVSDMGEAWDMGGAREAQATRPHVPATVGAQGVLFG